MSWVERTHFTHFQVIDTLATLPTVGTEGDLAYVKEDKALHVYVPDNTGGFHWVRTSPRGVGVDIQTRTGNTPTTVPPPGSKQVGDWYINRTDKTSWVFTPQPAGGSGWTQIGFGAVPPPRVHVAESPGYHPDGTHYNIKPGARPQINWENASNNPALLAAWNAAAQGSQPKAFLSLTSAGSLDVYVDNPAAAASPGATRRSDFYELRLDSDGIAAAGTNVGGYNSMHGPHEGNTDGGYYLWLNPDGTISIGIGGGGFVRKEEWAMHIFGSGDTPVKDFPLSKIGLTPTDLGVVQPLLANEGDEYVNTADKRSWVYDGTKWVERVYTTSASGGGAGGTSGWLNGVSADFTATFSTNGDPWVEVPEISIPFIKQSDATRLRVVGSISGYSTTRGGRALSGSVSAISDHSFFGCGIDGAKPSADGNPPGNVPNSLVGRFYFDVGNVHETIPLGGFIDSVPAGAHTLKLWTGTGHGNISVDAYDRYVLDIWEVDPTGAALPGKVTVRTMTLAAYNALGTKDPNTIYVIKETP